MDARELLPVTFGEQRNKRDVPAFPPCLAAHKENKSHCIPKGNALCHPHNFSERDYHVENTM